MIFEDDVIVYPANGAGMLCGKNLRKESLINITFIIRYGLAFAPIIVSGTYTP